MLAEVGSERKLTLRKSAKLRHKSLVDRTFREGKSHFEFPLRAVWQAMTAEQLAANFKLAPPERIGRVQMLITVPKKKRRHAVDRVLLRRRIRESFRLNRHIVDSALEGRPDIRTVSIAFVYQHNENLDYATIEHRMQKLLGKIARKLGENSEGR